MTVLTQLSVGAFAAIWLFELLGERSRLGVAALGSLAVGGLALAASTLHLGRPVHAYRALKMWKRSWLSREVLLFGCFSNAAALYAVSLWFNLRRLSWLLGGMTVLLGIAGIIASASIYLVRARPAWNSKHTVAEFLLTAALLGPLFAVNIGVRHGVGQIGPADGQLLILVSVMAASAQLLNQAVKFLRLTSSDSFELEASAKLLSTVLAPRLVLRGSLLVAGGIALPLVSPGREGLVMAFAAALGAEILGRYLFYVSVVPKNIAAPYLSTKPEAA
jgi:DMSO reductase anchor subunit